MKPNEILRDQLKNETAEKFFDYLKSMPTKYVIAVHEMARLILEDRYIKLQSDKH